MNLMKKSRIANDCEAGLSVRPRHVARVSRDGRSLTLRHSWPDDCDARVWDGVKRAFLALAEGTATRFGHAVEVYTHDGIVLEQVQPARSR